MLYRILPLKNHLLPSYRSNHPISLHLNQRMIISLNVQQLFVTLSATAHLSRLHFTVKVHKNRNQYCMYNNLQNRNQYCMYDNVQNRNQYCMYDNVQNRNQYCMYNNVQNRNQYCTYNYYSIGVSVFNCFISLDPIPIPSYDEANPVPVPPLAHQQTVSCAQ